MRRSRTFIIQEKTKQVREAIATADRIQLAEDVQQQQPFSCYIQPAKVRKCNMPGYSLSRSERSRTGRDFFFDWSKKLGREPSTTSTTSLLSSKLVRRRYLRKKNLFSAPPQDLTPPRKHFSLSLSLSQSRASKKKTKNKKKAFNTPRHAPQTTFSAFIPAPASPPNPMAFRLYAHCLAYPAKKRLATLYEVS